jgi:hypothetical protein
MREKNEPPVDHYVYPRTLRSHISQLTAWDVEQPLTTADWLSLPSQVLRSITSGAVHFDNIGELSALRERLSWYPEDVWLYMLAAGWHRIADEEHLMPRAGYVGDELGSALMGSRLVLILISLLLLVDSIFSFPAFASLLFGSLLSYSLLVSHPLCLFPFDGLVFVFIPPKGTF